MRRGRPGYAVEEGVPLLAVDGLRLVVGSRVLVDRLSFAVHGGETWCLIGPNGVGKTTLLAALAGLTEPAAGRIALGGHPLGQWPARDRARFRGFLPQALTDAFGATVLDAVIVGRHPYHSRWHWEDDSDRALARDALADLDLDGFEQRDVLALSGGERRRVALASVLAQDPRLLLLDEPVAHLDVRHAHGALARLRWLAERRAKGVLFSIHDLDLAARYATHALLFIGDGRVATGAIADVLDPGVLTSAFGHPIVRLSLGTRSVFVEG